jgi:hypothetical protein
MPTHLRKFNKTNITKLLIRMQDYGDLGANAMATEAVDQFGLHKLHRKLTGNPASAYKRRN